MADNEDKLDVEHAIAVLAHEIAEARVQVYYLEKVMMENWTDEARRDYRKWLAKETTRERRGILGTIRLPDDDDD